MLFRRIDNQEPLAEVTLVIEGTPIRAYDGETLAMAILRTDAPAFRETPVSASPRTPLCLMGVCFDCLVEVDGQQNVQACMVSVRDGMRVMFQRGARQALTKG